MRKNSIEIKTLKIKQHSLISNIIKIQKNSNLKEALSKAKIKFIEEDLEYKYKGSSSETNYEYIINSSGLLFQTYSIFISQIRSISEKQTREVSTGIIQLINCYPLFITNSELSKNSIILNDLSETNELTKKSSSQSFKANYLAYEYQKGLEFNQNREFEKGIESLQKVLFFDGQVPNLK